MIAEFATRGSVAPTGGWWSLILGVAGRCRWRLSHKGVAQKNAKLNRHKKISDILFHAIWGVCWYNLFVVSILPELNVSIYPK